MRYAVSVNAYMGASLHVRPDRFRNVEPRCWAYVVSECEDHDGEKCTCAGPIYLGLFGDW